MSKKFNNNYKNAFKLSFKLISFFLIINFIYQPFAMAQSYPERDLASIETLPQDHQYPVYSVEALNPFIVYNQVEISNEMEELGDDGTDIYSHNKVIIQGQEYESDFSVIGKTDAKLSFIKWVPFAKFRKKEKVNGGYYKHPHSPYVYTPPAITVIVSSINALSQGSIITVPAAYLAIPFATAAAALIAVGVVAILTGGDKELTRTLSVKSAFSGKYWG